MNVMDDIKSEEKTLFLDLDKVFAICKKCRKKIPQNLCMRDKFLSEISKNVLLFSKKNREKLSYKDYECAMMHIHCSCMKDCIESFETISSKLKELNFWSYCQY